MTVLGTAQSFGHIVELSRTNAGHLTSAPSLPAGGSGELSFDQLFMQTLNGANDLQLEADRLSQQMIINPDSVDTHDVTIALAQANLAVSLTKAVVDGALEAYSNIINMR